MKLTPLKITAIVIASIIVLMLLFILSYVLYVVIDYDRIGDNVSIDTVNNTNLTAQTNKEYSIVTFNIGFGAYNQEYNFFMDEGKYQDDFRNGKKLKGRHGRAKDKETVIKNTDGAISLLKDHDFDFMLFQEVDTDSTRSYHVNQYLKLAEAFSINKDRGSAYAIDYDSSFFLIPLNEPHGKSKSCIATFSKYNIESNLRREYPVPKGFSMYFDLDRCFMITRIPVANGKTLAIVNNHMSAYDKGGTVRAQQLNILKAFLQDEKDKGNYVIVGGDFNHDITGIEEAKTKSLFPTKQEYPKWVYCLTDEDLIEGYHFKSAINCSTCRTADIPYEKGVNFEAVLDGFIVSDNIEVVLNENIDGEFLYSDHNPATMKFKLK